MKLIIRDHIRTFKEDGELDSLLADLLFHMGTQVFSRPKKGRQHGVDLAGVGKDPEDGMKKIFLVSAKSGNLTRANWNSGLNSIKQSLDEILDVYIPSFLSNEHKKLPIKVIFALNGVVSQPALILWTNYKNKHSKRKIKIVEWDIDQISHLCESYLFNEALLPADTWVLLRKALAFIDVSAYDLLHVTQLFDRILFDPSIKNKKLSKYKRINLVNMCTNLMFTWGQQQNYIRNSLFVAEKAVLHTWHYISEKKGVVDTKLLKQFASVDQTLLEIQYRYLEKTIKYSLIRDSVTRATRSNHLEYSLVCVEYVGILSSIGLHYHFLLESISNKKEDNPDYFIHVQDVVNGAASALESFLKSNPGSYYLSYDSHAIEVSLVCLLFHKTNRMDALRNWLGHLVNTLHITFSTTNFFPLFHENYHKLVEAKVNGKSQAPESSILLTVIAEWCIVAGLYDIYHRLRSFKEQALSQLNLQLWYPDDKVEEIFFRDNADRQFGKTKYGIKLYEDPIEYRNEMLYELNQLNFTPETNLNFFQGKFDYLGLMASRHYRTLVFPFYWRSLIK